METTESLRFLMALIFVVSLMGGLWLLLKRLGVNGGFSLQQGKKRRLKIVEILPIDAKHKAILLRRDDKDHLVILGPNSETVIEHSIPQQEEADNVEPL
jgi:flagellar protein FliO/FliZ